MKFGTWIGSNVYSMHAQPLGRYLEGQGLSSHDLEAKSCRAHNFVFWGRILKLFHRNEHHIKTPCREQDLGLFLEDQGHMMTFQQNRFRPITLLFEVGFYNYLTEMITLLR